MGKFWNKSTAGADIYIYGDISQDKWFDSDTTAKSFVDDLNSFGGKHVTVHINSGGGDVFAGLAISNAIKNYSGGVTVSIDGLAASAASLIAIGGQKITMAGNALMMIHNVAVGLLGYYSEPELEKVQNSLTAIKNAVIDTYAVRMKDKSSEEIAKMLLEETWFSAKEALEAGLIDEITGDVSLAVDDAQHKIFINSLAIDTSGFDAVKMRRAMEVRNQMKETDQSKYLESIRQQEISRIRELQALKCDNAAINAVVDVAIGRGESVENVRAYLDALKKVTEPPAPTQKNTAAEEVKKMIRDQLTSGAEGVQAGQEPPGEDEVKAVQAKSIVDFANGMV